MNFYLRLILGLLLTGSINQIVYTAANPIAETEETESDDSTNAEDGTEETPAQPVAAVTPTPVSKSVIPSVSVVPPVVVAIPQSTVVPVPTPAIAPVATAPVVQPLASAPVAQAVPPVGAAALKPTVAPALGKTLPSVPTPASKPVVPSAPVVSPIVAAQPKPTVAPVSAPVVPVVAVPAQIVQPVILAPKPVVVSTPVQVPVVKVPEVKPEGIGIDTISLEEPEGNWLLKRAWWERAEARYDKIKGQLEEVQATRAQFSNKRTEVDRKILDPFYVSIGLGQAELSITLNHLISQITELRERKGDLSEDERDFLELVGKDQKVLEQLHLDVQAVNSVDSAIDDALSKLDEQIALCRGYDKKAWQDLKEIARELSDKKAQELYYRIEAYSKSIQDILNYVRTDYTQFFQKLIGAAGDHVKLISASVKELKEKGIDLEKQAKKIQDEAEGIVPEKEVKPEEPEVIPGWFDWLGSIWDTISQKMGSVYSWATGLFGGSESDDEEEEPTTVVKTSTQASLKPAQPTPATPAMSVPATAPTSALTAAFQVPPAPAQPVTVPGKIKP